MGVVTAFPRRNPDASFRRIGDEGGLVVLPGRAEVKVLTPVGILIFSLLDGSRDVDALAAAVADEFEVDLGQARDDVIQFLSELQHDGMLADGEPSQETPS